MASLFLDFSLAQNWALPVVSSSRQISRYPSQHVDVEPSSCYISEVSEGHVYEDEQAKRRIARTNPSAGLSTRRAHLWVGLLS